MLFIRGWIFVQILKCVFKKKLLFMQISISKSFEKYFQIYHIFQIYEIHLQCISNIVHIFLKIISNEISEIEFLFQMLFEIVLVLYKHQRITLNWYYWIIFQKFSFSSSTSTFCKFWSDEKILCRLSIRMGF